MGRRGAVVKNARSPHKQVELVEIAVDQPQPRQLGQHIHERHIHLSRVAELPYLCGA